MTKDKKKKEFLLDLKKEIELLEKEINNKRYRNFKSMNIRNLRIFKHTAIGIMPFVLSGALALGVNYAVSQTFPFRVDDVIQKANIITEYDTRGSLKKEVHYKNINESDLLFYYGPWTLNEKNIYQREIIRYTIIRKQKEHIIDNLDSLDLNQVLEFLKKPDTYYEVIDDLSELNSYEIEPYFKIQVHSVDENDTKIVKQSAGDNIGETVLLSIATICMTYLLSRYLWEVEKYHPTKNINYEKEQHLTRIDDRKLKKQLSIKRANYQRLTRKR